jgi:hypothetical protein
MAGGGLIGGLGGGGFFNRSLGSGYLPSNAIFNSGGNGAAKGDHDASQPVTADNFFDGTTYTSKVRNQAASGDYHGFPQSADGFSGQGTVETITGGDGVTRAK